MALVHQEQPIVDAPCGFRRDCSREAIGSSSVVAAKLVAYCSSSYSAVAPPCYLASYSQCVAVLPTCVVASTTAAGRGLTASWGGGGGHRRGDMPSGASITGFCALLLL